MNNAATSINEVIEKNGYFIIYFRFYVKSIKIKCNIFQGKAEVFISQRTYFSAFYTEWPEKSDYV